MKNNKLYCMKYAKYITSYLYHNQAARRSLDKAKKFYKEHPEFFVLDEVNCKFEELKKK